jgi:N-dimethylarginine dimethylaminohydrolase
MKSSPALEHTEAGAFVPAGEFLTRPGTGPGVIAHDSSEYDVRPAHILMHHPRHGGALEHLSPDELADVNFTAVPNPHAVYAEYDRLVSEVSAHVDVMYLHDVLDDNDAYEEEAATNPNLMFMRDSAITLPWAPEVFIPSSFALARRRNEPYIAAEALRRLGMRQVASLGAGEYMEGGDVLPLTHDGARIILVGLGERTNAAAVMRLAAQVIPAYADRVVAIVHDNDLLHLDIGSVILPNRTLCIAEGAVRHGFVLDGSGLQPIDGREYLQELGFTVVPCSKEDAIGNACNMLPIGDKRFVAFDMDAHLHAQLESSSGARITCLKGSEISKGSGGIHCLTRPLYQ